MQIILFVKLSEFSEDIKLAIFTKKLCDFFEQSAPLISAQPVDTRNQNSSAGWWETLDDNTVKDECNNYNT